MSRGRRRSADAEVDGPLQPDQVIDESVIDPLIPAEWDEADWSVREVTRVAVRARLTGDTAGELAAHRLLADVLGSTRGGHAAKRGEMQLDAVESEDYILAAADHIRAERKKQNRKQ